MRLHRAFNADRRVTVFPWNGISFQFSQHSQNTIVRNWIVIWLFAIEVFCFVPEIRVVGKVHRIRHYPHSVDHKRWTLKATVCLTVFVDPRFASLFVQQSDLSRNTPASISGTFCWEAIVMDWSLSLCTSSRKWWVQTNQSSSGS